MNFARPSFGLPVSLPPEHVRAARQYLHNARPNFRRPFAAKDAKAAFRPLSQQARGLLVRALPHMRSEVSGLTESGTQWLVESGDTGSKIALKLTGNANRWPELLPINKTGMRLDPAAVKKYGFPVKLGEKLNLPASWIAVKPTSAATSAPVTPSVSTIPGVSMPGGDIAAQGQARTILAAWGKSDGANLAGVTDYGSAAELNATTWTARDTLQGESFAADWNRKGGSPRVQGGEWSDTLAQALNHWMEAKAQQIQNSALSAGGVVIPTSTTVQTTPATAATPSGQPSSTTSTPAPTPSTLPQVLTNLGAALGLPTTTATAASTPTAAPTTSTTSAQTSPKSGYTDDQKWAFASLIGGSVAAGIIKGMFL